MLYRASFYIHTLSAVALLAISTTILPAEQRVHPAIPAYERILSVGAHSAESCTTFCQHFLEVEAFNRTGLRGYFQFPAYISQLVKASPEVNQALANKSLRQLFLPALHVGDYFFFEHTNRTLHVQSVSPTETWREEVLTALETLKQKLSRCTAPLAREAAEKALEVVNTVIRQIKNEDEITILAALKDDSFSLSLKRTSRYEEKRKQFLTQCGYTA